jgi:hypothetical protein
MALAPSMLRICRDRSQRGRQIVSPRAAPETPAAGRGGNLLHFTRPAIVSRTMPRALERPILEQVTQRHREMLMRADIAQRRDLALVSDETNRVTAGPHALEDRSFGKIG